jgi:acyl carrier protein
METTNTVLEKLQPIFTRVIDAAPSEVTIDAPRSQFAKWDSWAHLDMVMEIEAEFCCSFTMEETVGVKSVRDFVELIERVAAV